MFYSTQKKSVFTLTSTMKHVQKVSPFLPSPDILWNKVFAQKDNQNVYLHKSSALAQTSCKYPFSFVTIFNYELPLWATILSFFSGVNPVSYYQLCSGRHFALTAAYWIMGKNRKKSLLNQLSQSLLKKIPEQHDQSNIPIKFFFFFFTIPFGKPKLHLVKLCCIAQCFISPSS